MHKEALAKHLGVDIRDIDYLDCDHYGLPVFEYVTLLRNKLRGAL